jgi:hypothetical protein
VHVRRLVGSYATRQCVIITFKKGWKLASLRMAMNASSEKQHSNYLGRNVLGLLAIAAHALAPPAACISGPLPALL